jgi:subtilisin family serine protease
MEKITSLVLILAIFLVLSVGFVSAAKYNGMDYEPGKVIVKFKDKPVMNNKQVNLGGEILSSESGETFLKGKNLIITNLYVFDYDKAKDISKLIKNVKRNLNVEYAEPDYIFTGLQAPNDPQYSSQWNFPKTSAPAGWDIEKGNENIVISTIDTGINWNHEDLAEKIWNNLGEDFDNDGHTFEFNGTSWVFDPGDLNGIDDDGNGYIDDLIGYDFVTGGVSCYDDCATADNNPLDNNGHGTFQYGLMGARTNNSIGIAGLCQNCKLMIIRAGYNSTGGGANARYTAVIEGINYAVNNGVKTFNLAWKLGSSDIPSLHEAIINATNQGVLVTCAAGNDGNSNPIYPAYYEECFAVGARDQNDTRSSFSSYGSWVDISAPGTSLTSTWINNNYVSGKSGTSYASPQVTGLAGLIFSRNPSLNGSQVRQIINDSADYIATDYWIGGRINVSRALQMTPLPNQAPVLDAIGNKNVNEGNGLIIDVDASDANNDTLTYYTSASFGSFNSATGVFNWTPGYNDAGIYQVTFNVTDGFLWDSETINITVNNVNRQPVLDFISNKNVNENQIVTIVANASDADGDNLTYAINDSRFQQNGNIFTWQTDYNSAGTYYVLVSVSDGNLSDEQQVQVIVNDIPQYASLTGRIQLKGRENNLTMNNSNSVNVTMRNTANNQSSSYIVQSNYTGYFAIDNIIPGSYNIWVKPQFYLAVRNNSVILNTGSNNKDFGIAIGGDGNEDNKVSALDIAGFSGAYGSLLCSSLTYKWYFDFNSDCKINALDIAGFSGAYGSSGAAVV